MIHQITANTFALKYVLFIVDKISNIINFTWNIFTPCSQRWLDNLGIKIQRHLIWTLFWWISKFVPNINYFFVPNLNIRKPLKCNMKKRKGKEVVLMSQSLISNSLKRMNLFWFRTLNKHLNTGNFIRH